MNESVSTPAAPVAFPREALAALPALGRAVYRRSIAPPILANVKIESDGSTIALTTTDLEVTLQAVYPLETVSAPFALTVPMQAFAEACKGATSVTLAGFGTALEVRTHLGTHQLFTLPAEDFPATLPDVAFAIEGPWAPFAAAYKRVASAASDEEARGAVLMGTLIENRNGVVCLTATDGHALRHVDGLRRTGDAPLAAILPRGLAKILGALKGIDPQAAYFLGVDGVKARATLAVGPYTLSVWLVDGQYPNYQQVVPKDWDAFVSVDRKALLAAITQAAATAGGAAALCLLVPKTGVGGAYDAIAVSASSDVRGNLAASVPADFGQVTNAMPEIAFNAVFLRDLLRTVDDARLTLAFGSPLQPMRFAAEHDKRVSPEAYTLIMPLRR